MVLIPWKDRFIGQLNWTQGGPNLGPISTQKFWQRRKPITDFQSSWFRGKKKHDISACKFEAQKLIREALTSMEFEASQIQILDLETPLQSLRDRIDKAGVNNQVEKLISAMESVKVFFL